MTGHELLTALLERFREAFPEAEFREAYPRGLASRLLSGPVVAAAVAQEKTVGDRWEAKLDLRVYLPRSGEPEDGEALLTGMVELAREHTPLFAGAERGPVARESSTGLLGTVCSLCFSRAGDMGTAWKAVLGGREYTVSGVRTSVSRKGEDLVSIGEEEPFAVRGERTEYTVELQGIDTAGLERLAGFRAELGEPPEIYVGCRWKSLSASERKAVFVSPLKEG